MKSGEIYFLSFFKASFINNANEYLFKDSVADTANSVWDHLFQVRSFTIDESLD